MKKISLLLFSIVFLASTGSVFAFPHHKTHALHPPKQPLIEQPRFMPPPLVNENQSTVIYESPSIAASVLSSIASTATESIINYATGNY